MYLEATAQCIDSLNTHTIQSDRLLKSLRVKLSTSVQDAHRLNQFALWNASAIVTHGDTQIVLHIHLNPIACLHFEFVDRVVKHFLQ